MFQRGCRYTATEYGRRECITDLWVYELCNKHKLGHLCKEEVGLSSKEEDVKRIRKNSYNQHQIVRIT